MRTLIETGLAMIIGIAALDEIGAMPNIIIINIIEQHIILCLFLL